MIFNSDESRLRFDFEFNLHSWWLRSVWNYYEFIVTGVNEFGDVSYSRTFFTGYILPVCTI